MRLSLMFFSVMTLFAGGRAMAVLNSSDNISREILDQCDEQALAYEDYDAIIAAAAEGLAALGVFTKSEFRGVKIGFCDLQRVQGPVATTSCARDTILLDTKYANKDESLVLKTTLSHEMKHYFQHRGQKIRFGENYCFSDQYKSDKAWMEEEADAFGDNVAALLFIGRTVEIKNNCPVAVTVYLEDDDPLGPAPDGARFIDIAPQSTVTAPGQSRSKFFKFYAQSEPVRGERRFWRNATMAHRRMINGKAYGLKQTTLSNRSRATGPFQMKLSCSNKQNR